MSRDKQPPEVPVGERDESASGSLDSLASDTVDTTESRKGDSLALASELPDERADGMPSANERWLQFSRWILYHKTEFRATHYLYGTPEDLPSASGEMSLHDLDEELSAWDTASTPADELSALPEGLVYEESGFDHGDELDVFDDGALPSDGPEDTLEFGGFHASFSTNASFGVGDATDERSSTTKKGLFGRARRRIRGLRHLLRDLRDGKERF